MSENYYPITFDTDGFIIINNGTAPTPCKITIIPQVDFVLLSLTGVSEKPITVSNIKANDVLVIDAEERIVSINEQPAFDKYNGWEFPKLYPGENHIYIPNGSALQLSVEFNTRYI